MIDPDLLDTLRDCHKESTPVDLNVYFLLLSPSHLFCTTLHHSSFLKHPFHCVTPLPQDVACIFLLVKGMTLGKFPKVTISLSFKQTPVPWPLLPEVIARQLSVCFLLLPCLYLCTSLCLCSLKTLGTQLPSVHLPDFSQLQRGLPVLVGCALCPTYFAHMSPKGLIEENVIGMLWYSLRVKSIAFGNSFRLPNTWLWW